MLNRPRRVWCSLVSLLAPLLMGAGRFNYGMEIQNENDVRSTFVYGISKADIAKAGNKPSDFADCEELFEVSASDKARGQKPKFVEDKNYVNCEYSVDTTAEAARGVGLGLDFDADRVSLSIGSKFFNYVELDKFPVADFKVSVTFPGKVLSHSGSSTVDGNTVTWTDVKDSKSGMKAVSERPTGAASGGVPMFPVKRRGAGVMALALVWGPGRAPGS